jgi:hypothetical protein
MSEYLKHTAAPFSIIAALDEIEDLSTTCHLWGRFACFTGVLCARLMTLRLKTRCGGSCVCFGVHMKLTELLLDLHMETQAAVRMGGVVSEWFKVMGGF